MNQVHRYVLATLAACLIVALGISLASYLKRSALASIRTQMKEAAQAGTLADDLKGVDWDTAPLEDFETEVRPQVMQKIAIADFILRLWFVWVPFVFATCLGIAYFTHRG